MSMAMLHYVIHIYKSGHQKDMCFEKIRLSAQNLLIFLGSVVDINKGRGHACSFQHRHPPIDPHNSKVTKPQPTFILKNSLTPTLPQITLVTSMVTITLDRAHPQKGEVACRQRGLFIIYYL